MLPAKGLQSQQFYSGVLSIHSGDTALMHEDDKEPVCNLVPHDGGTSGHAKFLATTLAEHRKHLASIKETAPAIKNSIPELQEEVNSISSTLPPMTSHQVRSTSLIQAQSSSGRIAVLRDGRWQDIKLGDIIPADARLLGGNPLKIDQYALTGEFLPVTKKAGDEVNSCSTCKQGRYSFLAKAFDPLVNWSVPMVESSQVYSLAARASGIEWLAPIGVLILCGGSPLCRGFPLVFLQQFELVGGQEGLYP
ncbi:hypothetical protein MKW98_019893 [Papaver atlanticum]|uniref:P-type ATPase A domain-containing protein n=1 Tax=Papaver atlanticum TaxID=357466 RepID=A0AAD4X665_9MAGN|nr:hypothetical protein MKW98_019893 [Papaver atlanticum]